MKPIKQIEDTWHCDVIDHKGGIREQVLRTLQQSAINCYLVNLIDDYPDLRHKRDSGIEFKL